MTNKLQERNKELSNLV